MHPGLNFDLLSAEIEVCRELGVSSPIYISAGLDEKYLHEHPEHARLFAPQEEPLRIETTEDGRKFIANRRAFTRVCFNTPYLEVLKAQVEEVVRKFMPEGIFMDICSEGPCYCEACRRSVRELGYAEDDPEGVERVGYLTYKNYYTTINEAAKAIKPDIKVFRNGGHISTQRRDIAFSNTHLELESLPSGGWGYDHFPKSAKYAQNLGLDYLGMTGKFHLSWGEFGGFKHPNALRYEVALDLGLGAKASIGDQMHPYGFLDPATYELIGAAYSEAEKVEEYCFGNIKPISDVAVLAVESVTGERHNLGDIGAPRILLEGKHLFTFIDTEMPFENYKVIILPEGMKLTDEALTAKLKAFVKGGGKIIAAGSTGEYATKLFDLGCSYIAPSEFNPAYFAPTYCATGLTPSNYVFYRRMYDVSLTDENATVLAYGKRPFFNRAPEHFCSHRHTPFTLEDGTPGIVIGKEGAYIAWDIFSEYADVGSYSAKEAVIKTVDAVLGDGKSVKSVVLVPENREIPFEEKDGTISFTIDKLECSRIVVINV